MPLSKDVGKNIKELTAAKKGQRAWPRKRIIAAAMNAARDDGGKVSAPKGKHMMKGGHMMDDEDMPKKKPKLRYLGKQYTP